MTTEIKIDRQKEVEKLEIKLGELVNREDFVEGNEVLYKQVKTLARAMSMLRKNQVECPNCKHTFNIP